MERSGKMKYVVIGAGGTGGPIGGFLTRAGKDVTLIARGEHLKKIREYGLQFETPSGSFTVPVKACAMEEYQGSADVIFVCVKGYSLADTIPFIERIGDSHTVVIPVLNIYGTGKELQKSLPDIPVMDGCMYIASEIQEPGKILISGNIFRVIYGLRKDAGEELKKRILPVLIEIEKDLKEAGSAPEVSDEIEKGALQKFSFISPMAALGSCYDVCAAEFQKPGPLREKFVAMVEEIKALSDAMGIHLPDDIAEINLKILDGFAPQATASMQRDIKNGRQSELDGLVCQVVRMGEQYHVPVPVYKETAEKLLRP